jgi:lipoyl(octanoyl) transferase
VEKYLMMLLFMVLLVPLTGNGYVPQRHRSTVVMKISTAEAASSATAFARAATVGSGLQRPNVAVIDLLGDSSAANDIVGGLRRYGEVWEQQKALLQERVEALSQLPGRGMAEGEVCPLHDALILVEHFPVFTLGSSTKDDDVSKLWEDNEGFTAAEHTAQTRDSQPEVVRVDRGGEATWHGPGQLVTYPVLDLRRYKKDIHWYLRALEEVGIRACTWTLLEALEGEPAAANVSFEYAQKRLAENWGVRFGRVLGYTGCWLLDDADSALEAYGHLGQDTDHAAAHPAAAGGLRLPTKVMATGVSVKRWITQHGIAINCNCDTSWASKKIVPCGIEDLPVGSLQGIADALRSQSDRGLHCNSDGAITPRDARPHVVRAFAEIFTCEAVLGDPTDGAT